MGNCCVVVEWASTANVTIPGVGIMLPNTSTLTAHIYTAVHSTSVRRGLTMAVHNLVIASFHCCLLGEALGDTGISLGEGAVAAAAVACRAASLSHGRAFTR